MGRRPKVKLVEEDVVTPVQSEADRMFKLLGFDDPYELNNKSINYKLNEEKYIIIVSFIPDKGVSYYRSDSCLMSFEIIKAINMKLEELGWS